MQFFWTQCVLLIALKNLLENKKMFHERAVLMNSIVYVSFPPFYKLKSMLHQCDNIFVNEIRYTIQCSWKLSSVTMTLECQQTKVSRVEQKISLNTMAIVSMKTWSMVNRCIIFKQCPFFNIFRLIFFLIRLKSLLLLLFLGAICAFIFCPVNFIIQFMRVR